MNKVLLTDDELNEKVGEAITLATVIAIMSIALLAIVAYKLFTSKEAVFKLPGGYQFTWN